MNWQLWQAFLIQAEHRSSWLLEGHETGLRPYPHRPWYHVSRAASCHVCSLWRRKLHAVVGAWWNFLLSAVFRQAKVTQLITRSRLSASNRVLVPKSLRARKNWLSWPLCQAAWPEHFCKENWGSASISARKREQRRLVVCRQFLLLLQQVVWVRRLTTQSRKRITKGRAAFGRLKQCFWNERSAELQTSAWYAFTFINIPLCDYEIWITALFLPSINQFLLGSLWVHSCWCKRPGKGFRCWVLTSLVKYSTTSEEVDTWLRSWWIKKKKCTKQSSVWLYLVCLGHRLLVSSKGAGVCSWAALMEMDRDAEGVQK